MTSPQLRRNRQQKRGVKWRRAVSQALRGRWSSIDGVTIFGWSGSALLGGVLIDRNGFGSVFFVTAAIQLLSMGFLLPLLFVVPRREGEPVSPAAAAASSPARCCSTVVEAAPGDADLLLGPQRPSQDGAKRSGR